MKLTITEDAITMTSETELERTALKSLLKRRTVELRDGLAWEEREDIAEVKFLTPPFDWGT